MGKWSTNYLYPCRGITKGGKSVRGDVIAPTAVLARKYFAKGGIKNIKVGKRREIGKR